PGSYKIYVRYEDKEITGSPFLCKVTGGEELAKQQVAKIKCSGNALKEGKANLTNEIVVDTKESGIIGGLSVSMEGPAKPEINFKNSNGGVLILQYKPSVPGQYKLHLKFQEIHVPGSPFPIRVAK
ncbi:Cheerio / Filamin-A/C -like protein, partial [Leptotrombidium deliense]